MPRILRLKLGTKDVSNWYLGSQPVTGLASPVMSPDFAFSPASGRPEAAPGELNPPSVVEPSSQVTGPTHDLRSDFSLTRFERAIREGGTILLPAGTLDISGINAPEPGSGGVRIVGEGKDRTTLVGGFSRSDYSASSNDVFIWFNGRRIELEAFTVRKVRCGILGANGGSSQLAGGNGPDATALDGLRSGRRLCGNNPDAGITMKRVRMQDIGRPVSLYNIDTISNLDIRHTDFIDSWAGFLVRFEAGGSRNWFFYDTLWQDIIIPNSPGSSGEARTWAYYCLLGVGSTSDLNSTNTPNRDIRFEHCTWNGLTSRFSNRTGGSIWPRLLQISGCAENAGNWARNCLVKNYGSDSRGGNRMVKTGRQGGSNNVSTNVSYTKGYWRWEKSVFNGVSGSEGLFNRKGGAISGDWPGQQIIDCWIENVYPEPDDPTRAILGPRAYNATVDNVYVKDATVSEGFWPNGYGNAYRGKTVAKNITIDGMEITTSSDWGHIFHQGSSTASDRPDFELENIKVRNISFAGGGLRALLHIRDTHGRVSIRRIDADVSGSGAGSFTLLEGNAPISSIDGIPTGVVRGVSQTFAQTGSNIANRSLGTYSGPSITGFLGTEPNYGFAHATIDYGRGSGVEHVGCAPRS